VSRCKNEAAESRLRAPRRAAPNIEKLREALMQRAAEWKATLPEEPKVARLLLRRLIGPLVLTDDSQRPDWIDAEAEIRTGLLDGIHDVASPTGSAPFLVPALDVPGSVLDRAA
jgi:hypothetical protein